MRHVLFIACASVMFLLTATWIAAGETASSLWRADARAAWQASQASGRPMLLYVTSRHCPYCHLMDRDTFTDRRVQARMRGSFEPARVLTDREPALARNLGVRVYPTTVVVNAKRQVVGSIQGYLAPRAFERRLLELAPPQEYPPKEGPKLARG